MASAFVGPSGGLVGAGGSSIGVLRDRLRIELHDPEAANYRWQDGVLDRHLARALNELSLACPRGVRTRLILATASREVNLSALNALIRVEAVEYPVSQWQPEFAPFSVFGNTLTLLVDTLPTAGDAVDVYWTRLHDLDASQSTLPAALEEVLLAGAAGYAAIEWASFATNRANVGGPGAVDDYRAWGEERLKTFRQQTAQLGEQARVRARRLFSARGGVSRQTVQWEQ